MNLGEILVRFGAETSGFSAGVRVATGLLETFKNAVGNLSFGMQNLSTTGTVGMDAIKQGVVGMGSVFLALGGIVAVAAGAVAIALGVHAVRAAGDFQQSITKLFTTAGELHSNLQMVGDGVLSMAASVGTGAQQLANAMYFVESGGYHGAAGLEVLRVAAMGAKAENADLNGVAKVLTFTMNAYAAQHMSAATAMNTLIASTARGTMTLGELSGAVSNVLPAAARFGISLIDVGAALATMTSQGDKADSAATHLRQVILALEAPSKLGAAALKSVGLTTQQVSDEMKVSLPATLAMITDAVGKKFPAGSAAYNAAIRDIAGGSRQMMGFLELTGVHLKTFQDNVNGITDAVHKGGTAIMGWSDVQANFNFRMDQARAAVGALFISVGMQLLPAIGRIAGQVAPLVTSFASWLTTSGALSGAISLLTNVLSGMISGVTAIVGFFQRFEAASALLKGTLITLGAVVGVLMVAALYSYAAAAYTAAAATLAVTWPILAVIAAVALLVAGFIYFYNTSAQFRAILSSIGQMFVTLWGILQQGWAIIVSALTPAINQLGVWFAQLGSVLSGLWPNVQRGWNLLQQGNPLFALIGAAITAIASTFMSFGAFLAGLFVPVWQHLVDVVRACGPVLAQLSGAGAQLMGAMRGLWASIQPLIAQLQAFWQSIAPTLIPALQLFGIVIVGVVVTALGLLVGVLAGVIGAIAGFLQGVVFVVQGIVQVFTGLVQIISGIVALIVDVCTGNFGKLAADLGLIWQGILNVVQGTFTAILGVIVAVLGAVIGFISGFVTTIISFFTSLYNALVGGSIVPDMCNGIVNAFQAMVSVVQAIVSGFVAVVQAVFSAMGAVVAAVFQTMSAVISGIVSALVALCTGDFRGFQTSVIGIVNALESGAIAVFNALKSGATNIISTMISGILNIFHTLPSGVQGVITSVISVVTGGLHNLASLAFTAAANIGKSIVSGLNSMLGAIGGAASAIAGKIASFLPHSPAEQGPLARLDEFGPGMANTFAAGIIRGAPVVHAAMNTMVTPPGGSMISTPSTSANTRRPVVIVLGPNEYHGFIDNVGHAVIERARVDVGGIG